MMLFKLYLFLSLVGDVLITVFGDTVNSVADIWKPILLYVGLFFGCLLIHILFLLACVPFSREEGKVFKPMRWITIQSADIVLKLCRVKVHVTGMEKLPENTRFLAVANHRSIFDPIIGLSVFGKHDVAYIAKKETMKIPVGKYVIMGAGCLFLDRNNDRAAVKTIIQAANILKNDAYSMAIYPEGGTNKTAELLLPFRNGAFKIAQRAGAPVVVYTSFGTEKIHKRVFLRRTDVYIDILDVLSAEDITGVHTNEIGDKAHAIMLANLEKHTA